MLMYRNRKSEVELAVQSAALQKELHLQEADYTCSRADSSFEVTTTLQHIQEQTRSRCVCATKNIGKPNQIIGAIDDNIDEMWERLHERYGDSIRVIGDIEPRLPRYQMAVVKIPVWWKDRNV